MDVLQSAMRLPLLRDRLMSIQMQQNHASINNIDNSYQIGSHRLCSDGHHNPNEGRNMNNNNSLSHRNNNGLSHKNGNSLSHRYSRANNMRIINRAPMRLLPLLVQLPKTNLNVSLNTPSALVVENANQTINLISTHRYKSISYGSTGANSNVEKGNNNRIGQNFNSNQNLSHNTLNNNNNTLNSNNNNNNSIYFQFNRHLSPKKQTLYIFKKAHSPANDIATIDSPQKGSNHYTLNGMKTTLYDRKNTIPTEQNHLNGLKLGSNKIAITYQKKKKYTDQNQSYRKIGNSQQFILSDGIVGGWNDDIQGVPDPTAQYYSQNIPI